MRTLLVSACLVNLTVTAGTSYNNVPASVRDAAKNGEWSAPDAPKIACCWDWPFPALKVPCAGAGPPFSFNFMASAVDDNPAVGTIVATCVP